MTTIQTVQDYLSRLDKQRYIDISLAVYVLKDMKLLHGRPMTPSTRYLCDCMASMHMALQSGPAFKAFCPGPEFRFLPPEPEPRAWSPDQAEADARGIWTGYGMHVDSLRPAGTVATVAGRNAAAQYKEAHIAAETLNCRLQPGPHRERIAQAEHEALKSLDLPSNTLSWNLPETKAILWRIDPREPLDDKTIRKAVYGYVHSIITTGLPGMEER